MERVCSMIGNTKVPPPVVRLTLVPECRKPYLFHRNDMSIRWAWMRNEQVRKGVVCVGGRVEGRGERVCARGNRRRGGSYLTRSSFVGTVRKREKTAAKQPTPTAAAAPYQ